MVTRNVRRFAVTAALFVQLTACDGEAIAPCPDAGDTRDARVTDMAWRSPNALPAARRIPASCGTGCCSMVPMVSSVRRWSAVARVTL